MSVCVYACIYVRACVRLCPGVCVWAWNGAERGGAEWNGMACKVKGYDGMHWTGMDI